MHYLGPQMKGIRMIFQNRPAARTATVLAIAAALTLGTITPAAADDTALEVATPGETTQVSPEEGPAEAPDVDVDELAADASTTATGEPPTAAAVEPETDEPAAAAPQLEAPAEIAPLAASEPAPIIAQAPRYPAKGGTKRFADVPRNHQFYTPITWMYAEGLTTGIKAGTSTVYRPKATLTREAMAAFLYRQAGSPKFTMPRTGFIDVPRGHQFYKPIMWMKATGLTTGIKTSRGTAFAPKSRLSREAMAAFLYRQAGSPRTVTSTYRDVPRGHKFYRAIAWMKAEGLTTGVKTPRGTVYAPLNPVTREAMAAFLHRQAGSPRIIDTGSLTITGSTQAGQTLTAKPSGWQPSGISYAYQWLQNGKTIAGATSKTYKLPASAAGKHYQVRAVGTLTGSRKVAMTSSSVQASAPAATIAQVEDRILYLVNEERAKRGLHKLWKSDRQGRARAWSQNMIDSGIYQHSPAGWYSNPTQGSAGIVGENIVPEGNKTKRDGLAIADEMFTAWMNSTDHRNAMLSPNIASAAAGVAFVGELSPDVCDADTFDCSADGQGAYGSFVMSRYYPDNVLGDLFPFPYGGEPTCAANPSFEECQPGGRSLPRGNPPGGSWG